MKNFLNDRNLEGPYPEGSETALFGLGCFWGAEKSFWKLDERGDAIFTTAVGYAGGALENPSYQQVCTGTTNHNEVVLVVFDPEKITYQTLLKNFWESHDPTQGMRQGNDMGSQYRSGIYCTNDDQLEQAKQSKDVYQAALKNAGHAEITTEIIKAPDFYLAEEYHQQYLAKNPNGYCGLGGVGVCL